MKNKTNLQIQKDEIKKIETMTDAEIDKIDENISKAKINTAQGIFTLGVELDKMKKIFAYRKEKYKDFDSFKDYIESAHGIKLVLAYEFIRIAKKFGLDQLNEIGISKCRVLLPVYESGRMKDTQKQKLYDSAKTNTVTELKDSVSDVFNELDRKQKIKELIDGGMDKKLAENHVTEIMSMNKRVAIVNNTIDKLKDILEDTKTSSKNFLDVLKSMPIKEVQKIKDQVLDIFIGIEELNKFWENEISKELESIK